MGCEVSVGGGSCRSESEGKTKCIPQLKRVHGLPVCSTAEKGSTRGCVVVQTRVGGVCAAQHGRQRTSSFKDIMLGECASGKRRTHFTRRNVSLCGKPKKNERQRFFERTGAHDNAIQSCHSLEAE